MEPTNADQESTAVNKSPAPSPKTFRLQPTKSFLFVIPAFATQMLWLFGGLAAVGEKRPDFAFLMICAGTLSALSVVAFAASQVSQRNWMETFSVMSPGRSEEINKQQMLKAIARHWRMERVGVVLLLLSVALASAAMFNLLSKPKEPEKPKPRDFWSQQAGDDDADRLADAQTLRRPSPR